MKLPAIRIAVTALFAVLLLAGCASKSEVEDLQQQARQDRQEARALYLELEQDLKAEIQKTSSPVQERQANFWAEMNALRDELALLKGQVDEMALRMDYLTGDNNATASLPELSAQVDAMRFAMEHQLAIDFDEIEKKLAATRPAAPMQSTLEASPKATEVSQPDTAVADPAQALYDRAYSAFGDRNYAEARSMWAEFVTAYPDHPLVPNSIFWQGECYYQMQDYQRAVLAYQDVIKKYPKSSKFRYALLKQGISFYKLDKADLGRIVLQDLVEKYPDSSEASRARQYMDEH